jgi:hypothetical protein
MAARRVPWQVLLQARTQYLEWQEFYFWVRSIIESEQSVPDWLARRLEQMCPGFLLTGTKYSQSHSRETKNLPLRLGGWIEHNVFGFAARGGWLPAITFYAVREPRHQRASVCWSESVRNWKRSKPTQYPTFEQWLVDAAKCDDTARLLPEIRKERECYKRVDPKRLEEAVSCYLNWEALAYWARSALEHQGPLAEEVERELSARCSGFAELTRRDDASSGKLPSSWGRLMLWIGEQFFPDAKAEGWYDAIVISARIHPRAIRIMEYADHCDEVWKGELPVPYPSFEGWQADADRYVEVSGVGVT